MEDRVEVEAVAADLLHLRVAVDAGDAGRVAGQQLGGEVAQGADDARPYQPDLGQQERRAGLDLVRLRVAVVGRPRLEDVGDEDLLAAADRWTRAALPAACRPRPRTAAPACPRGSRAPRRRTSGPRTGRLRRRRDGVRVSLRRQRAHASSWRLSSSSSRPRRVQWQVAQCELEQVEQLLPPPPPRSGDDEWTAKRESRRRTSAELHEGQLTLCPLRTSSSKRLLAVAADELVDGHGRSLPSAPSAEAYHRCGVTTGRPCGQPHVPRDFPPRDGRAAADCDAEVQSRRGPRFEHVRRRRDVNLDCVRPKAGRVPPTQGGP